MTLRFLGTTSDGGDCPTLYEVEGTGDVLVQGDRVTDPVHLAMLRDVKESETFVIVPRDLLARFAPTEASTPKVIPFNEASHLFREFKHTAWRLETRRGYGSDRNSAKWQRWLAGQDVAAEPFDEWRRNVQAATEEGRRFERVRLVDDPPTEGQRFLLATAPSNVAAGEDIRNLQRADAVRLGLPDWDFWLFDSRVLVRFVFDEDDTTVGVVISEDPTEVLAACQARDKAWHHAIRTADFSGAVRSTA
ncbi:hypothetical protein P8A21_13470 [Streptomyces poriferorum]|uniref:DUF6879 family protein n=1 Tax=Streptomyces poriferorum TaxID=2798799 RepID=UPI001C600707|nr:MULTISPECIES: DUF6879 family protein [Streptomyces]MBW5250287.1 hypothetical protein [Streptomyces poriferorum]MBW5261524.1 hypothetical protein [Streptomyces poriferorum]WLQ53333.1 hypothetical protein P8A21_13470 [Streptomyces sp. Alt1]